MYFSVVSEIVSSIVLSIVLRDRIRSRKPPEIHGNALHAVKHRMVTIYRFDPAHIVANGIHRSIRFDTIQACFFF